jgi:hypothetical protein
MITKWRIDHSYIDEDGYVVTNTIHEYRGLEAAMHDYEAFIASEGYGWYKLIEVTEKVITF